MMNSKHSSRDGDAPPKQTSFAADRRRAGHHFNSTTARGGAGSTSDFSMSLLPFNIWSLGGPFPFCHLRFKTMISPGSNPLRTPFVIVYQITRWVELPSRLLEEVDLHQTDQHPALHKVSLRATDPMIIITGTLRDYPTPLPI